MTDKINELVREVAFLEAKNNKIPIDYVVDLLRINFDSHECFFTSHLVHGMNHLPSDDDVVLNVSPWNKTGLEGRN